MNIGKFLFSMRVVFILAFSCIINNVNCAQYKLEYKPENNGEYNIEDSQNNTRKVDLQSGLLKLVDGKPGLMDHYMIRDIMYIGRELTILQLGNEGNNSKKRIGKYKFDGRLWTLKELVRLEQEYIKSNRISLLKDLFDTITTDFRKITKPYLSKARENKSITLRLIVNFCKITNRMESYLLKWGEGHGNEKELFFRHINSLKDLDVFCTDLLNFLVTLVHNCPKGYAKYIQWRDSLNNKK